MVKEMYQSTLESEVAYSGSEEALLSEQRIMERVLDHVDMFSLEKRCEPTLLSVARLEMYNFLTKFPNASQDEVERELVRIERLSNLESKAKDPRNPLPTIGIEIEFPSVGLTPLKRDLLNELEIPNQYEKVSDSFEDKDLWEVSPRFSYSARVQARMLQEIEKLEVLPKNDDGTLNTFEPLSLHINFATPKGVGWEMKGTFKDDVVLMSDMFAYAFASPHRIFNKKTFESYNITQVGLEESSKNKFDRETTGKEGYGTASVRVELRIGEFSDSSTYRQLIEAQRIAGMMMAHNKYKANVKITFIEAQLADLWEAFSKEAKDYLVQQNLEPDMTSKNPIDAALYIKNTDIQPLSRHLISDYSRKVAEILKIAELDFNDEE